MTEPRSSSPLPRTKAPEDLRSARWFGPADLRSFGHRSRAMQMGYSEEDWRGKPIIGILNTWSDIIERALFILTRQLAGMGS